jgi:hypothetical protein
MPKHHDIQSKGKISFRFPALWSSDANCGGNTMHQPKSTLPNEFNSLQVVARFVLRLLLVSTFATFGTRGFGTIFGALLELLAIPPRNE